MKRFLSYMIGYTFGVILGSVIFQSFNFTILQIFTGNFVILTIYIHEKIINKL